MSTKVKRIVFSAMAIALATVIATVLKLPSLPYGGSITLFSMLVICLVGYWYGPATGIIAAVTYGILQFITGPYIVHPAQVVLDFPLAFGALGLSGFFHNKKHGLLIGYIVGVTGRFIVHCISGMIFYTAYVGELKGNIAAILGGYVYNLSYILPEAVLTIVLISIPAVSKMLAKVKAMATE